MWAEHWRISVARLLLPGAKVFPVNVPRCPLTIRILKIAITTRPSPERGVYRMVLLQHHTPGSRPVALASHFTQTCDAFWRQQWCRTLAALSVQTCVPCGLNQSGERNVQVRVRAWRIGLHGNGRTSTRCVLLENIGEVRQTDVPNAMCMAPWYSVSIAPSLLPLKT